MARITDEEILKTWSKEKILKGWNETRRHVFWIGLVLACVAVLLVTIAFG